MQSLCPSDLGPRPGDQWARWNAYTCIAPDWNLECYREDFYFNFNLPLLECYVRNAPRLRMQFSKVPVRKAYLYNYTYYIYMCR